MAKYFLNRNAQSNGDHEVHKEGCYWLTLIANKKDLGYHSSCHSAVLEAKKTYRQSNGCATCSNECHTS
ncbi:hypothetical protein [Xanthomarina gelatinilytica]|uniref:hypothetical protein n=1 Tax=Xanthomarina gelatinilytica TaxID=1137281 RepID=UPI003AA91009